jgi:hypothetical protein
MLPAKFVILSPLSDILLWLADMTTPKVRDGEVLFKMVTNAPTRNDICVNKSVHRAYELPNL